MTKETILSGIQPSGRLHIGNYLGSVKNFLALQNQHQCFFMVADYHSITETYSPNAKQEQVIELMGDFLAAGLDPKKCVLFVQSHVSEHTELAWILDSITPISFLERMTQYKDKAGRQTKNINTGLFTYPVLQAADILMYHTTAVPVGIDQDQHLELTREIARFFNNRFSKTFVEPRTLHTETPKVMSLLEPTKKMSKSLGDNHCIYLNDSPETIHQKLSRAVSDSGNAKSPGGQNLLSLSKIFCAEKDFRRFQTAAENGKLSYGELKPILANALADYFSNFRAQKKKITRASVKKVMVSGAKQAKKVAIATMEEVRKKIGIR